jgi:hypothetical protein
MSFKLISLEGPADQERRFGDVFTHEVYPTWSRVTICADQGHIRLMLEIAEQWSGPYGVLYVLVSPRLGTRLPATNQQDRAHTMIWNSSHTHLKNIFRRTADIIYG